MNLNPRSIDGEYVEVARIDEDLGLVLSCDRSITMYPSVSVIILNYNGRVYLSNCFESLAKINYPRDKVEVLLVDNGSTDGSTQYVREYFPWVRILSLERNLGFCEGNNKGATSAKSEYILFLNNDVTVDENWLIELMKVAVQFPNDILTNKLLCLNNPKIINFDGAKATLMGRGFNLNFGKENYKNVRSSYIIQPYGASMIVKKDVFMELGMFDRDYFISLEDFDIGVRAWLLGHKVIYVPSSIVYHKIDGTEGKKSDIKIYCATKNALMNVIKNFDLFHMFQGIFFCVLYDAVESLTLIREKTPMKVRLKFMAYFWVVKNLRGVITKRENIRCNRKLPYQTLFNRRFFASLSEACIEWLRIRSLPVQE